MRKPFERTWYGLPYLVFVWLFGLASLITVSLLVGLQAVSFQQFTKVEAVPALVGLLLVMLCVFLRYQPKHAHSLTSEDALAVCIVLVFRTEIAVVVMGIAAMLNTVSQLTNRKLQEDETGPWIAFLGELLFQGGMIACSTMAGSTVYKAMNGGDWSPFTIHDWRKLASILFVYCTILLVRWALTFVHSWTRGIPLVEYSRGVRELQSFQVFLPEVANVLICVAMANVYFVDWRICIFLAVAQIAIVAMLSNQNRVTLELQSSVLELKIVTGIGKALSTATQTRKELLKALYTQGKELLGADSFAIYLYPEGADGKERKTLQLAGLEYVVQHREHRRQSDPGNTGRLGRSPDGSPSGKWSKNDPILSSGNWPKVTEEGKTEIPEENAIGLAEWCLGKGRVLRIDDLSSQASLYGYSWLTRQLPFRSWMGVPLEANNRPLGVISVASESRRAFSEQNQELLKALSQQVVSALDNARLFELATVDGLTGLFNSRHLRLKLAEAFSQAQKNQKPLSIIMVDIDYFKKCNDTYGHEVGNEVLKHVAGIVRTRLRDTDLAARYGGEEFTVLLPNTPPVGALEVAERLRSAVEHTPAPTAAGMVSITVSLGTATFPTIPVADQDALLAVADKALYQSKQNGRNRVTQTTVL
ncbi:MAG: sensor domain-containing diguanylate cyclase [Blastocatellia bacterium]|nr:sensor domain-containing diguanylate cyclase [Blastocatellia bacterium]